MTDATAVELGQQALSVALMIAAPMLGTALLVGLIVSVFQAATQIQEMTLTFVPKIAAVVATLIIFGPWMMNLMVTFSENLLRNLPSFVH